MRPALALAMLALAAGCASNERYAGAFALPSAITVTAPDHQGPFDEPIAFVANEVGGAIRPLAARQGRFLTDTPTASFARAEALPTGRQRAIADLAAYSPGPDALTVFAADPAYGHLLEIPYVTGKDGAGLALPEVVVSGVPSGFEVRATRGATPTEDWTLTWRDGAWWLEGTRSGRLAEPIPSGDAFDLPEVGLTVTAPAGGSDGEQVGFRTDFGMIEHDLGMAPSLVELLPSGGLLAVAGTDPDGVSGVWWFDPILGRTVGQVVLPEGSRPVAFDQAGGALWIADAGLPFAWRVGPGESTPTAVPLPTPVRDLAIGEAVGGLFVVPIDGAELWAVDLASGELRDLNPWAPGIGGFPLYSPVRGIAALPTASRYPYPDAAGVRPRSELLAISLASGAIVFFDQRTGCLVPDRLGPRTQLVQFGRFLDYSTDFAEVGGAVSLASNATNDRSVVVNTCAGIARAEGWRLTFDAAEQAWIVTGEVSGEQTRRAYEDIRYTSDRGQISFVLRSGTRPSIDGWTIDFAVTDGGLRIASDQGTEIAPFDFIRRQLTEVRFSLPGDPHPLAFVDADPPDAGWGAAVPTSYALVPIEGSNAVARILPDDARADAFWR